jgi:uncharacterized protein (TIGR03118 family)
MNMFRMGGIARAICAAAAMGAAVASCGGGGGGSGSGGGYAMTALVSDSTGTPYTDSNLVNGWGVAFNPQGYVWVANGGTRTSTLYDGNGVPQSLVVTIPDGAAGEAEPTGIVFNGSIGFVVTEGSASGPAAFLFANKESSLAGWAPTVNLNTAITVVDSAANEAAFTGLALAQRSGANFLYAADFHNGEVAVWDSSFNRVSVPGGFADANLPGGYGPFGIQAIGGKLYVTYAKQDADARDEVVGAGLGLVDVFDANGTLLQRLVAAGGPLNAPWGLAMAPMDFGDFGGALLVGNFGDGKINAFNPTTGAHLGALSAADGTPIVADGLWGMAFGNGINSQPTNTLFFAAGPDDEAHGLYGRIDVQ